MLDHGTWYDGKELFNMTIVDAVVIGALKPPSDKQNEMSPRFTRHFNSIYIVIESILFSIESHRT